MLHIFFCFLYRTKVLKCFSETVFNSQRFFCTINLIISLCISKMNNSHYYGMLIYSDYCPRVDYYNHSILPVILSSLL